MAMKEQNKVLEKKMQESYAVHIQKDVQDYNEAQKQVIEDKKKKN